jgi:diazepam-binding inhibitor (GABA receptor modulating acyl-CoA-binding protein)
MSAEFLKAAEDVKKLTNVGNDDLLELYGLFKQVNVGDCNTGIDVLT